jgi:hypothetical protein
MVLVLSLEEDIIWSSKEKLLLSCASLAYLFKKEKFTPVNKKGSMLDTKLGI